MLLDLQLIADGAMSQFYDKLNEVNYYRIIENIHIIYIYFIIIYTIMFFLFFIYSDIYISGYCTFNVFVPTKATIVFNTF